MKKYCCLLGLFTCTVFLSPAQSENFLEITRLPFTSDQYDEFAPVYFNKGIVFVTNRRKEFLITRITDRGENLLNIYYTDQSQTGKWHNPDILSRNLSSNYHDGPVSFTADGSRIFFTRNLPDKQKDASLLGIFMAEYINGEWTNIIQFPFNSNNYNVTHPAVSDDGKTLYFASDMPGGYGGMDIYTSTLQGQSWSAPVNLGMVINSEKDEVFPYIHPGGRLYYSSNNNNRGTLDLFYSKTEDKEWQIPVRLPEPLNSEADDFGFIADRELVSGYFSSGRAGSDNIYSFISTFPKFSQCDSIQEPPLCYVFYEETAEDIDTTQLYYEWDMGDGTRIRGQEAEHCFEDIGSYTVRLDVIDRVTGEVQNNVAYYPFRIERIEQPYITSPDSARTGKLITFDASETYLRNFDVEGYYWEMGDGTQYEGEIISHIYDVPGVYQVSLGVVSDPESPWGEQKKCVYKYIKIED